MTSLDLINLRLTLQPNEVPSPELVSRFLRREDVYIELGAVALLQKGGDVALGTPGNSGLYITLSEQQIVRLRNWLQSLIFPSRFGGVPLDIRRELLLKQGYSELVQSCSLPEFASICSDDKFWADKLGITVEQWRDSDIQPLSKRYLRLLWKYRSTCEPGSESVVSADVCLRASVKKNRHDLIEYFLARSSPTYTSLETLGEYGNIELIRRLIPNPTDRNQLSDILSGAAAGDKRNVIAEYLPRVAQNDRSDVLGRMLAEAVVYGRKDLVRDLIADGANLEDYDFPEPEEGASSLDPEILAMLLQVTPADSAYNLAFESGRTGNENLIQMILSRYPGEREPIAEGLARGGHEELFFKYVVDIKSDMLSSAIDSGNLSLVRRIVERGILPDHDNVSNAARGKSSEILEYILSVSPQSIPKAYQSIFEPDMLRFMLQRYPPSPEVLKQALKSAWDVDIARVLLAAGAEPDLDIIREAARYGRIEMVKLLAAAL